MNDVERIISEHKLGVMVAGRIRKAYPTGEVAPYEVLRGWYPSWLYSPARSINRDLVSVSRFIEKFGVQAYRNTPKTAFYMIGKRKAISRQYAMNLSRPA